MAKEFYAPGDDLPSEELDEIAASAGLYAASAAGNDTYAITVSPAFDAYGAGLQFTFLADVGNTGACTLNVNTKGAVAIKKMGGITKVPLETGDIKVGEIVRVIHDGTDFLLLNNRYNRFLYNIDPYTAPDDTSENTVFSVTIPGNSLGVLGMLRIRIPIKNATTFTDTQRTVTVKLKLGATAVATATITFPTPSTGNARTATGFLEGLIVGDGASNDQDCNLYIHLAPTIGNEASNSTPTGSENDAAASIDMTADQALSITVQKSNSAGATLVFGRGTVEIMN